MGSGPRAPRGAFPTCRGAPRRPRGRHSHVLHALGPMGQSKGIAVAGMLSHDLHPHPFRRP
eukprot:7751892-Heterocapsa_arctica.AAC.1